LQDEWFEIEKKNGENGIIKSGVEQHPERQEQPNIGQRVR
jgi:hypothetical protein